MTALIRALCQLWGHHVHLQQISVDRHDVTGAQALEARRSRRASGERLLDDWIALPR